MEYTQYLSWTEIHKQNHEMKMTFDYIISRQADIVQFFADTSRDIVFLACGSSYWMSLSAHKTWALLTGRRCFAVKAGDVVLAPEEYTSAFSNPYILCPSRSGLTGEVLDAIGILKSYWPDAKVFSITEFEPNSLSALSDLNLRMPWVGETSVCQTRSFSCLYAAFTTIAAILSDNRKLLDDLAKYMDHASELYRLGEEQAIRLVEKLPKMHVVSLAVGRQYGVAIEGAYIVTEMAEQPSNYYQLLEYRHGPVVTAGNKTVVFICCGGNDQHEEKMAQEARARGATICTISGCAKPWADFAFDLGGEYQQEVVALHFVFVLQSIAFHLALALGGNPDSPGGLVQYIVY